VVADVPDGYKRTEVGVIPNDWNVALLTDLCGFKNGGAHEPFIDAEGKFICVNSKFISTEGKVRKHSLKNLTPAKKGDVLIVMSDLPNGKALAKTFLVDQDNLYAVNQRIGKLSPRSGSSKFLSAILNRNNYFLKFDDGVSQTHLLNPVFKECLVQQPSIDEQNTIAEALTDADEAIRSLEAVIAKKRDMKQAALHALLTPTRRLPGFSDEWDKLSLGKCASLKARIGWQGLTTKEYQQEGPCGLITGTDFKDGNIDWSNIVYVEEDRYTQDMNIQVKIDDVLITKDGTIGKVALVKSIPIPTTLNSGVFVIRPKAKAFHPKFLYYILLSEYFEVFLKKLSAGSTINHLYQKDFVDFQFPTPPSIKEQAAIAAILSDMDAEIEDFQARLDKLRDIKQGMMQVLLTGKVRLI